MAFWPHASIVRPKRWLAAGRAGIIRSGQPVSRRSLLGAAFLPLTLELSTNQRGHATRPTEPKNRPPRRRSGNLATLSFRLKHYSSVRHTEASVRLSAKGAPKRMA